ncbi:MAG: dephospho-CoA kinase [Muribaculaceae bacterium]|nr:dephospho-CoA kinase [Muribaculaceae bacterium]
MLIAISGGIGSGKSVVARMLRTMGYLVYDCDVEAKRLMDSSPAIKLCIANEISADAIAANGSIDRQQLSAIVFSDKAKLELLNSIVHGAVKDDLTEWSARNATHSPLFVETAILYQSGLDKLVDRVIEVVANDAVRIERVCHRNSMSEAEVLKRIESQRIDVKNPHPNVDTIDNNGSEAVLPQLLDFLKSIE